MGGIHMTIFFYFLKLHVELLMKILSVEAKTMYAQE